MADSRGSVGILYMSSNWACKKSRHMMLIKYWFCNPITSSHHDNQMQLLNPQIRPFVGILYALASVLRHVQDLGGVTTWGKLSL